jgi:Tfp pilus assembly protein PilO
MNLVPQSVWEYLAISAIGVLVTIIGWYARNTREDLKEVEKEHEKLKEFVFTSFHPKADMDNLLTDIKESVRDLHKRFDALLTHIKG